jgi:hypothetical protein
MSLERIVSELKVERNRLDQAISVLESGHAGNGRKPARRLSASVSTPSLRKRRRHLTPAGRRKLSQLMKQRWAERRKKVAKS